MRADTHFAPTSVTTCAKAFGKSLTEGVLNSAVFLTDAAQWRRAAPQEPHVATYPPSALQIPLTALPNAPAGGSGNAITPKFDVATWAPKQLGAGEPRAWKARGHHKGKYSDWKDELKTMRDAGKLVKPMAMAKHLNITCQQLQADEKRGSAREYFLLGQYLPATPRHSFR